MSLKSIILEEVNRQLFIDYMLKESYVTYTIDKKGYFRLDGNVQAHLLKKILLYNTPISIIDGELSIESNNTITSIKNLKVNVVSANINFLQTSLKSLEGCPVVIYGSFICYYNMYITSLQGCTARVMQDFKIILSNITNIQHSPYYVGRHYSCSYNKITLPEGIQLLITGLFLCTRNKLLALLKGPKMVEDNYGCKETPGNFTELYVRSVCLVKGNVFA